MIQTKTQTSTVTNTVVATLVVVAIATAVGAAIGISQWQNNQSNLVIDDLNINNSNTNTALDDGTVVLRGSGLAGSDYGSAVANAGDLNGDGHDDLVVSDSDASEVYAYFGNDTAVSTTPDWTITWGGSDNFGWSVAGAGDVNGDGYDDVIVGERNAGSATEGAAYLYYGSVTGPTTGDPDWSAVGITGNQYFGQVVAGIGDANGDTFDDVAIFTGNGADDTSLISVYHGSATGLGATANWTHTSRANYFERSINVAGAGDVNGDGYDDMIFGNPELSGRGYGQAAVFYGSVTGFAARPNFVTSTVTDDYFGGTVAAAGDMNSDGYDDVIVGSPDYTNGEDREGAAHVYYGSSAGMSRLARLRVEANSEGAWMGMAASTMGDTDGDGYDDIVVTAPGYDSDADGENRGQAMVYGGSATGMMRIPIGIHGASAYDGMDVYGIQTVTSETLVGTATTDIVITVESYDEADADGPAVLVYSNIEL